MQPTPRHPIAVVGLGAVLPDAPDVAAFWDNVRQGRYSVSEVPPERWDPELFWDPDPKAPDKSYSKIGGWVTDFAWDPLAWKLPIPPKVGAAMDRTQKWAVMGARQALADFGYPDRPLDPQRTAVILGNAMAGDRHYQTSNRLLFPEVARDLEQSEAFARLDAAARAEIQAQLGARVRARLPEVNEDTMPGELANIIAGRVANLFNFHGPNYVCDAACASAMAALSAAVEGLDEGDYDAVLSGGIDANMSAATFIKFCKIGALSATGTRPYGDGADGFVMGEGAAVFLLKRLADAERDGDRVYAVIRGVAGASDGRGKGITAPNPVGQKLAVERAWATAGLSPADVGMIEGHGTSTKVGDVVEVESLHAVFGAAGLRPGTVPLGSVKSNIGHLKGAAGAAGILKATLALHHKVLPPSLNCTRPNPALDLSSSPFRLQTELADWAATNGTPRRAGVSAFGFGGTNFHVVMEEWTPGAGDGLRRDRVSLATNGDAPHAAALPSPAAGRRPPLRGILLLGAATEAELAARLRPLLAAAETGSAPPPSPPAAGELAAPLRLAVDYGDAEELATKGAKALRALESGQPGMWRALRARGIFLGRGAAPQVAFLYTGQGSQYAGMLQDMAAAEPLVAQVFAEADAVMEPLLGRPLTDFVFVDDGDAVARARAEEHLRQTRITQPAVLAVDVALTRLLAAYGIAPDLVMGHSLGEYGALVAAGCLPFAEALEAVSARGREMTQVSVSDAGKMAAVFAPIEQIEATLERLGGDVVVANLNSNRQAVIGGASDAVERVAAAFRAAGHEVRPLPVSHAFHTHIVEAASKPLSETLQRLHLQPPRIPVVANVHGGFYPMAETHGEAAALAEMKDLLARQIASPVQFVQGLETLYEAGARAFVELGPKRALTGFTEDVLGSRDGVHAYYTNHPKVGGVVSFNQALAGLYAAGLGAAAAVEADDTAIPYQVRGAAAPPVPVSPPQSAEAAAPPAPASPPPYAELGRLFADFLDRGYEIYRGAPRQRATVQGGTVPVITGAGLGLPGTPRVFDDGNVGRLLRGDSFLDAVPMRHRQAMVERNVVRVVKDASGNGSFETIGSAAEVLKLAARAGAFDLAAEFGIPEERLAALDRATQLAVGAGLEALRDAGIPLAQRYRRTTKGTWLPERWGLPDALRDDTGVIFASAFPGYDAYTEEIERFHADRARRLRLAELEELRGRLQDAGGTLSASSVPADFAAELERRIRDLTAEIAAAPYRFDRRFLFRVLSMGHSQFAELIGARGPNTQINAACASTTQAVSLAEEWIRAGRCRRCVVISADDITSDRLLPWFGAGFLASGAAATDELVEDAALPFDRRRHGLLIGMGAAALVVESADAAAERGLAPIAEVLSTVIANSAFHGTRLDVEHIRGVVERLVADAEARWGVDRHAMAQHMVFVSHETYTPARGGSASAEVESLRHVFGASADRIVVANTKGFTGHAMATGIEDVVAVKALETGMVPPVANFRQVDPDLGSLNLSRGGLYPVELALRLGAGFGSQIALSLIRRVPVETARPAAARPAPEQLGYAYRVVDEERWQDWLRHVSGHHAPELEVVRRTLRLKDQGPPEAVAAGTAGRTPSSVEAPLPAMPPEPQPLGKGGDAEAALAPLASTAPAAAPTPGTGDAEDAGDAVNAAVAPALAPAPPQAATPSQAAPAPAVSGSLSDSAGEPVRERVLQIVAEQTGYPPEMLDLDLDMEADLGIDTVKQAETFAAIRGEWGIERDESMKLRDYPTLGHAIQFVYDKRPELRPAAASASPSTTAASAQPAPPPQPAIPSTPAEGLAPTAEPVRDRVLAIVAEQTGYPPEMLDLDLDMEADLGIDTVKQAETFAAIRGEWGIERDESMKLRDYPTLGHAIQFVYDKRPELRPAAAAPAQPAPAAAVTPAVTPAEGSVASEPAMVATGATESATGTAPEIPRRVPTAVLRPSLDLCKPTGVELGDGRRVVLMSDRGGIGKALAGRLGKRGVEVLTVDDAPSAETLTARLAGWLAAGPVHGLYWLPALDVAAAGADGDPATLSTAERTEALRVRAKLFYTALRGLYDALAAPGAFMVAGTRLGGRHGYDDAGAVDPLGGAVTGLAKTLQRELPDCLVKAVDFPLSRKTAAYADALVAETLSDPGAVEIGRGDDGRRWTVALLEQADPENEGLRLGPDGTLLVTGAAGSIVSAIVADLAAAAGGATFHLFDLTPEPDPADADLARFDDDRDGLKRDLFARLQQSGERATPAKVERELARLERSAAALAAMQAVQRAGGQAVWHRVDLTDAAAVAAAVAKVRDDLATRGAHLDALIHAAGVEISHLLPDKEPAEFDLVFDVKAAGWLHLLAALDGVPIGAAVLFSSIAGRFGNAGQADYAAANDLLCKSASSLARLRPSCRALAVDWTAWGGLGMATRGSIPKMMAAAGIDMLPPEAGVPFVRSQLAAGRRGEIVAALGLGAMTEERDATGGLTVDASTPLAERTAAAGPMVGRAVAATLAGGLLLETDLDPAEQPFLDHHRIDGTPVLPGVMGLEAFAEAASLLAPDLAVVALEDVEFLSPFKFYRGEPRTVTVEVQTTDGGDGTLLAHCRLLGHRDLPQAADGTDGPQTRRQETVHFTGRVRLAAAASTAGAEPAAADAVAPPSAAETTVGSAAIYRLYFHGPAYRVLHRAWRHNGVMVGDLETDLPPDHRRGDHPTHLAPRWIELAFQTAGLWQLGADGSLGLPRRVERIAIAAPLAETQAVAAVVEPRRGSPGFDARLVDAAGRVLLKLTGYHTVELPGGVDREDLAPLTAALGSADAPAS